MNGLCRRCPAFAFCLTYKQTRMFKPFSAFPRVQEVDHDAKKRRVRCYMPEKRKRKALMFVVKDHWQEGILCE